MNVLFFRDMKLQIKNPSTGVALTVGYNSLDVLCFFEVTESEMTFEALQKALRFAGVKKEILANCKLHNLTIIEIAEDLSFDAFWKKYDYKQGKVKAAQEWNKINETTKAAAIAGIAKYKKNIPAGIAPVYAERYLKYRRWED